MELEYFVKPSESEKWHHFWQEERLNWYLDLGIKKQNLRFRPHQKEELAHYALSCVDVEYLFSFKSGEQWGELEGIANRGDYDLKTHSQHSGKDLSYFDEETNQNYLPFVIEPSAGVERSFLAFLMDAYDEDEQDGEVRTVLRLSPALAPVKVAVLPLVKNNPALVALAQQVLLDLKTKSQFLVVYDEVGSIGRRYRRQDEIGTPWCVTIDHQSLEDETVTVRDRDSLKQERVKIKDLYFKI